LTAFKKTLLLFILIMSLGQSGKKTREGLGSIYTSLVAGLSPLLSEVTPLKSTNIGRKRKSTGSNPTPSAKKAKRSGRKKKKLYKKLVVRRKKKRLRKTRKNKKYSKSAKPFSSIKHSNKDIFDDIF